MTFVPTSAVEGIAQKVVESGQVPAAVQALLPSVEGVGAATAGILAGLLTKASITNLDTYMVIPCMFSPKEYSLDKSNSWTFAKTMGKNVPVLTFQGGESASLKMELLFDTYELRVDVRRLTNQIWKLMEINPKTKDKGHKGSPPLCEFRWGFTWSFKAVVTNISQKFTLFLGDGTPVRSIMNVTFKQYIEEGKYPAQNPTTMSAPGYKTRRVRQGETLDWIAHEEYGDSSMWRFLADANDLMDPLRLSAGQALAIPPRP